MAAAQFDITIDQGATLQQTFKWTSDAGVGIDLTGYTAQMQVRSDYADNGGTIYLTLSSAAGTIVITPASGQIDLVVPPATTQGLTFTSGVYDLEVTSPTGVVTRLVRGTATLSKEVTR